MTDVKCRVSSCHYWGSGDVCKADSIMVDQNPQARSTRMEVGDLDLDRTYGTRKRDDFETGSLDYDRMDTGNAGKSYGAKRAGKSWETGDLTGSVGGTTRGGTQGGTGASTSEATMCRTFRPKSGTSA